jgi:CelD/BcsL family acetyltransferase involved in cellulose biosynthesis
MQINRNDRGWNFAVLSGQAGFGALLPGWQALVDRLPAASYLQQPGWIGSHLAADPTQAGALRFVVARRAQEVGAVLVLRQVGGLRSWVSPALEMVTGEHLVLADLVADPDDHSLWPAMRAWLTEQPAGLRWAVMRLPAVSAGSAMGQALQDPLQTPGAGGVLRTHRTQSAWLDCRHDAGYATHAVTRSFRQNINRLQRRAQAMGHLHFEVVQTLDALGDALEEFLSVESSGWKRACGTAIALDPALVGFYRQLVQEFGARGNCRIHLLRLDGRAIAAQFGLVSARQLNLLKIGYSEEYASVAPGHLVMRHTIEHVCADPALDRLSFVTHPNWSHLWKPQLTEVECISLFAPTMAGRVTHALSAWWREQRGRKAGTAAPGLAQA